MTRNFMNITVHSEELHQILLGWLDKGELSGRGM